MNSPDEPKTLDERLTTNSAIADHNWSSDEDGSIDVTLRSDADRDDILALHYNANTTGYSVTFSGENADGTTDWNLSVAP